MNVFLLVGIRHHQGLLVTDEMTQTTSADSQPDVTVRGKGYGTYTGLFIGYGFKYRQLEKIKIESGIPNY